MSELTNEQEKFLQEAYYKKLVTGMNRLYSYVKDHGADLGITARDVNAFVRRQRNYQLTKVPRDVQKDERKATAHIVSKSLKDLFQGDLVDMSKYARIKANKNNNWIFTIVRVHDKRAHAFPVKNKRPATVLAAFKQHEDVLGPMKRLNLDNGNEFGALIEYLKDKDVKIRLISPGRPQENSVVERFNGTLKTILGKHFKATNKFEWLPVLDQAVDSYNKTVRERKAADSTADESAKEPRYAPGDRVRLANRKLGKFEKRSFANRFSKEIYTVQKVERNRRNKDLISYKIRGVKSLYPEHELVGADDVEDTPFAKRPEKTQKSRGNEALLRPLRD